MTVLGYHNLPSNDYVLGKSLIPNIYSMIEGISDHLLLVYVKAFLNFEGNFQHGHWKQVF